MSRCMCPSCHPWSRGPLHGRSALCKEPMTPQPEKPSVDLERIAKGLEYKCRIGGTFPTPIVASMLALLREARELLEPIESRGYGQTCGWYKRRDDFLTRVRGGEGG